MLGSKPPKVPIFTKITFEKYIGVPFDINYPNIVPITLIVRGNIKHIPLKMAWVFSTHKFLGMTLQWANVDRERKGLMIKRGKVWHV